MMNPSLIAPYGGTLVDLFVSPGGTGEMRQRAISLPSLTLSARSMLDLELLCVGAFSPLATFMGKNDYENVRDHMRLASGVCFPMPITLPVDNPKIVKEGEQIVLTSPTNECVAIMTVKEMFSWDWRKEAREVFGTESPAHPLVSEMKTWGKVCVSGPIQVLRLPPHDDFPSLYGTPKEVRARLGQFGKRNIVAFQTRNPLHRGHEAMITEVLRQGEATVLLHPATGMTNPGDVEPITRIHTYEWMMKHVFVRRPVLLQLLTLAMRMAGPREAVWHAIIRRNYGANYLIVGRDHASPGSGYYAPFAAQKLASQYATETGVSIVPFDEVVYEPKLKHFVQKGELGRGTGFRRISATKIRRSNRTLSWAIRPEIAQILSIVKNHRRSKGYCVWFTGLPSSGKSTIANLLATRLRYSGYNVIRIDGDMVRQRYQRSLGFSKADRNTQVSRVGRMAKKIMQRGSIAICSLVSPYEKAREKVQHLIGKDKFIEVYLATPLPTCEKRDTKLLFLRARAGFIKHVTGIDDPYEVPKYPDIRLATQRITPLENVSRILMYLKKRKLYSEAIG